MGVRISCSDLGIAGCNFAATGETPGDAVRTVVDHVRAEHNIDLPDADTIMDGRFRENYLEGTDQGAALIIKRLAERFDTFPPAGPDVPRPAIGRLPNQ